MHNPYRLPIVIVAALFLFVPATAPAQTSDDFAPETSLQPFWRFFDPIGDVDYELTGANVIVTVPSGTTHDLWRGDANKAPRFLQAAPDTDLGLQVGFESLPYARIQLQGIILQNDHDTFLRCGTFHDGTTLKIFKVFVDGDSVGNYDDKHVPVVPPRHLRVQRAGLNWTYEYSEFGATWHTAYTFTQAISITEVGFYVGNAPSNNPYYVGVIDYFMNLDTPINDSDSYNPDPTPPVIDVWHGDTLDVGQLGNPQKWVNIVGRVNDDDGVRLEYTLNVGATRPLTVGPGYGRLMTRGDFCAEIDGADLLNGANTLFIKAEDTFGATTTKIVTINYTAGNVWPLPYTADFTAIDDIADLDQLAQPVDGHWKLDPGGVRTVEPGYDRLLTIGDKTWPTEYDVEVYVTMHSATETTSGVGFAVGWQGHEVMPTSPNAQPRMGWPLQAIAWPRALFVPGSTFRIEIYDDQNPVQSSIPVTLQPDVPYVMKARSETLTTKAETSRFWAKIWPEGAAEPDWQISADIPTRPGSVLLIAHRADVTWKKVIVTPLRPAITDVTVTETTMTSATITWKTNVPASSEVKYGTTAAYELGSAYDANPATSHSLTLDNLTPHTTYHFAVRSLGANGVPAQSDDDTFTTPAQPAIPPVITSIKVSTTDTIAMVTWQTDIAATSAVAHGPTAAYENGSVMETPEVTSHTIILTPLTPQATYHFQITSETSDGGTAQSDDDTFMTQATPSPVTEVNPTSLDFGTVAVGGTAARKVTIKNVGNADLAVTSVTVADGTGVSREFSVTINPAPVTLDPPGTKASDTEVEITYAPTDDGADVGSVIIASNDPAQGEVTIPLVGTGVLQCTLTLSSSDGGTVTKPGEGAFENDCGTAVAIEAVPAANYHFVEWTGPCLGDVADPTAATTTVTLAADCALVASFAIDTFTLAVSATDGGVGQEVTPRTEYDHGTLAAIEAVPEAGFSFLEWTGTAIDAGKVTDPTAPATTVLMDGNYTVAANFAADAPTGGGGDGGGGSSGCSTSPIPHFHRTQDILGYFLPHMVALLTVLLVRRRRRPALARN